MSHRDLGVKGREWLVKSWRTGPGVLSALKAKRIYLSEPSLVFISCASSRTFPSSQRDLSAQPGRTGRAWLQTLRPIELHPSFVYIDLLQLWLRTQCGQFWPLHKHQLETPFVLTALPRSLTILLLSRLLFSWRVSVSDYCSPDVLGSLSPIRITSDYFLPTFLISVSFCIAFLSSLKLSAPPVFASSKHFVKSIIPIF